MTEEKEIRVHLKKDRSASFTEGGIRLLQTPRPPDQRPNSPASDFSPQQVNASHNEDSDYESCSEEWNSSKNSSILRRNAYPDGTRSVPNFKRSIRWADEGEPGTANGMDKSSAAEREKKPKKFKKRISFSDFNEVREVKPIAVVLKYHQGDDEKPKIIRHDSQEKTPKPARPKSARPHRPKSSRASQKQAVELANEKWQTDLEEDDTKEPDTGAESEQAASEDQIIIDQDVLDDREIHTAIQIQAEVEDDVEEPLIAIPPDKSASEVTLVNSERETPKVEMEEDNWKEATRPTTGMTLLESVSGHWSESQTRSASRASDVPKEETPQPNNNETPYRLQKWAASRKWTPVENGDQKWASPKSSKSPRMLRRRYHSPVLTRSPYHEESLETAVTITGMNISSKFKETDSKFSTRNQFLSPDAVKYFHEPPSSPERQIKIDIPKLNYQGQNLEEEMRKFKELDPQKSLKIEKMSVSDRLSPRLIINAISEAQEEEDEDVGKSSQRDKRLAESIPKFRPMKKGKHHQIMTKTKQGIIKLHPALSTLNYTSYIQWLRERKQKGVQQYNQKAQYRPTARLSDCLNVQKINKDGTTRNRAQVRSANPRIYSNTGIRVEPESPRPKSSLEVGISLPEEEIKPMEKYTMLNFFKSMDEYFNQDTATAWNPDEFFHEPVPPPMPGSTSIEIEPDYDLLQPSIEIPTHPHNNTPRRVGGASPRVSSASKSPRQSNGENYSFRVFNFPNANEKVTRYNQWMTDEIKQVKFDRVHSAMTLHGQNTSVQIFQGNPSSFMRISQANISPRNPTPKPKYTHGNSRDRPQSTEPRAGTPLNKTKRRTKSAVPKNQQVIRFLDENGTRKTDPGTTRRPQTAMR